MIETAIIEFITTAARTKEEIVAHVGGYRPRVAIKLNELVRDGRINKSWCVGKVTRYSAWA